ncbi:UNVERIFIED_CONTAM: cytochrome [Sesamum latifolium]|uniref:Cytochrome n=1 Tax=Sesamum latifolium TaxID=2727402 RepID=A0AAW2VBE9_9LAMI
MGGMGVAGGAQTPTTRRAREAAAGATALAGGGKHFPAGRGRFRPTPIICQTGGKTRPRDDTPSGLHDHRGDLLQRGGPRHVQEPRRGFGGKEDIRVDEERDWQRGLAHHSPVWPALADAAAALHGRVLRGGPLDAMRGVRAKCVDQMVRYMGDAAAKGLGIDVGRFFFLMAFNLIGNLIFSKDLLDPESETGAKFFYHAGKATEFAGKPNVADFLPMLKWIDPQGIRRRTQFHVKRGFDIAGEFLKERMEKGSSGEKKRRDYLDVLLEYGGDGEEEHVAFSPTTINIIVFEMFTAGTDTTTSTLEWAMAELLHNPQTLHKVQTELRTAIRPGKKLEEEDLEHLPYLRAVIKETLRLHPPLPFLVPHMAMDSCKMLGFHVPKETQILVNVWAIGRDPETWKDPLEFRPERFLDPDMAADYKGHHFEFIPFGSGRRICPAVPLAARVLPLTLGSVLHAFDWVLADGLKPAEMDMRERMGITLRKAVPVKAVPVPYVCV